MGFLHTSILVTLFTGSQFQTWRRIHEVTLYQDLSLQITNQAQEGWPPYQGLRTQLFSNSGVGSLKSHKNQIRESAVRRDLWFFILIYTFADVITKAAVSSQLFKEPERWSSQGLNPRPTSTQQTGALPTELTRWLLSTNYRSTYQLSVGRHIDPYVSYLLVTCWLSVSHVLSEVLTECCHGNFVILQVNL